MEIRSLRKEFNKQMGSVIRQVTGNLITMEKMQNLDPRISQQNKNQQLQRIKALYDMQSQESTEKSNEDKK